ncbi:MAG: GNAT family N-acetyltransferase [Cyanobacteria bacterium P01_B01_bin.77]
MVHIRSFQPEDALAVAGLILPIQQSEFGIPITLEAQPDLLNIQGFYQRNRGNFWVGVAGGRVIGTVGLLGIGNGQAALRKMFVAAAYRGKQHGVAQRLLEQLVVWCRDKAITSVYLGTTAKFLAAHRFYEKNGFGEIEQSTLPETFPIMAVDTKFYKLEIKRNPA